jgi:hypothetical protein
MLICNNHTFPNGHQTKQCYFFDSISRYVTSLLFPTLFPGQSLHSNKTLNENFFHFVNMQNVLGKITSASFISSGAKNLFDPW